MARLLDKSAKQKPSKAEAAGYALTKLRLHGSLTVPLTADFLGIHKYTVKEYIEKGLIETFVVGSRHYVTEDELYRVKQLLADHGSLAKVVKEQGDGAPE